MLRGHKMDRSGKISIRSNLQKIHDEIDQIHQDNKNQHESKKLGSDKITSQRKQLFHRIYKLFRTVCDVTANDHSLSPLQLHSQLLIKNWKNFFALDCENEVY